MPAARPSATPEPAAPSFESAMERLEAVVEQMENSKLPLEDLIRSYEEGTQLIKVCSERLAAAEQRMHDYCSFAPVQQRLAQFLGLTPMRTTAPQPAEAGTAAC